MWTVQLSRFLKTILYIWQDYWLSLLYKRLVGPEVLKAEVHMNSGQKKQIRAYLHCTNRKRYVYSPAYNKNIFFKETMVNRFWHLIYPFQYTLQRRCCDLICLKPKPKWSHNWSARPYGQQHHRSICATVSWGRWTEPLFQVMSHDLTIFGLDSYKSVC